MGGSRLAAAVEYDGRGFCGFQSQPSGCAVQDAVERALAAIAESAIRIVAAGRTDAGVHATSQIIHFDAPVERPLTAWVRGTNSRLPPAAAVMWCAPVAPDFHARYSAFARHYTYLLLDRPVRPALAHGRVGWFHAPLDVPVMQEAAAALAGTHDFSSFRAAECQAKSPMKTLSRLAVVREGSLVRFEFTADGFLQHMVRNIVAALVDVGAGRRPREWVRDLLDARDRTRGAATFAPDGLYFTGADYDARFALPPTRRDLPAFAL